MIVVRMTLISPAGKQSDLGTMIIVNQGTGTDARGDYIGKTIAKNAKLDSTPVRVYPVSGHRRKAESVWSLVRKLLVGMGY